MQRTRQQILERLKRSGGATVDQLAADLGLVPVTVRAHLAVLERDSLASGEEVRHGGAGRPHIVYTLTEQGEELFPKRYDQLANRLLDVIQTLEGEEKVNLLLEQIAEKLSEQHLKQVEGKNLKERVDEASHVISEQGCTSEWEKTDEGYLVNIYNCPYRKVMQRHPQLCTLESHLLKNLTGHEVKMLEAPRHNGIVCSYLVPART